MSKKRILVTGASGCIGHYITEALIQETDHELYLLVRNPNKLKVNIKSRPGVTLVHADMQEIERFSDLLKTMDSAILVATAWGGPDVFDVNVVKTLQLLELLDPNTCQQVIYFSTASLLDRNNQILQEAGELGIDYIRSKYACLTELSKSAIAPKITTLFPTLVLGGDAQKPYSHSSTGIGEVIKWMSIIRFLQADGSLHFIHGRDIATVVRYLIDNPLKDSKLRQMVLGQERLTVDQAIEEVCTYLGKKIYFRIPLSLSLANLLIVLFRIQMSQWDRFCLDYRHFTYKNIVNPARLGLPNYCSTISDVLKISGIPRRGRGATGA